jgi:drug/metabolite transporter (DMT)-like permease
VHPQGFVCSTEWDIVLVLIMSGLSSCVGMLWLTLGFQIEKAGIASSLRYIDVVLAFIIDFAILGAPVKSDSLIGGAIILTGAIIIAFRRVRAKNT